MSVVPRTARPLLNGVATVTGRRFAGGHGHAPNLKEFYKGSTMNDLPSPSGSWAEAQSKRSVQYNLHLLFGIATLSATIAYIYVDEDQFMNWAPPELPEDQFGKRPKTPWLGIFRT